MSSENRKTKEIKSRIQAIEKYMLQPNVCLECQKIILINDGDKIYQIKMKRFCNKSCAASYNNKRTKIKPSKTVNCKKCGELIFLKRENGCGAFIKVTYCDNCLYLKKTTIERMTKKEMFDRSAKYYIGRNAIRKNATVKYHKKNMPKICKICGYSTHIEVCHIKSVSDFPDEALISEINSLDNLVALCPNHHWEFDNNIIKIDGSGEEN